MLAVRWLGATATRSEKEKSLPAGELGVGGCELGEKKRGRGTTFMHARVRCGWRGPASAWPAERGARHGVVRGTACPRASVGYRASCSHAWRCWPLGSIEHARVMAGWGLRVAWLGERGRVRVRGRRWLPVLFIGGDDVLIYHDVNNISTIYRVHLWRSYPRHLPRC